MMTLDLANAAGFIGMALILGAYAYQTASARVNPLVQHGLNLIGALLIVTSLLVHTNLPSLVLESVWAVIAVYGLVKAWRSSIAFRHSREGGNPALTSELDSHLRGNDEARKSERGK
jgi:hypothetical protein